MSKVQTPPGAEHAATPARDELLLEAMRRNHELAHTVIRQVPALLEAAARLLRAAAGAGFVDDAPAVDVKRKDQLAASPASDVDWQAMVASVLPALLPALPGLGPREHGEPSPAVGATAATADEPTATEDSRERPDPASANDGPAPKAAALCEISDEAAFAEVLAELAPADSRLARALAAELLPSQRRKWLAKLATLPISKAAAHLRALLHAPPRPREASREVQPFEGAPPPSAQAASLAPSIALRSPTRRLGSLLRNAFRRTERPSAASFARWGGPAHGAQPFTAHRSRSDALRQHAAWRGVLAHLTEHERTRAQRFAALLDSAEVRAWWRHLADLPLVTATDQVRALVAPPVSDAVSAASLAVPASSRAPVALRAPVPASSGSLVSVAAPEPSAPVVPAPSGGTPSSGAPMALGRAPVEARASSPSPGAVVAAASRNGAPMALGRVPVEDSASSRSPRAVVAAAAPTTAAAAPGAPANNALAGSSAVSDATIGFSMGSVAPVATAAASWLRVPTPRYATGAAPVRAAPAHPPAPTAPLATLDTSAEAIDASIAALDALERSNASPTERANAAAACRALLRALTQASPAT